MMCTTRRVLSFGLLAQTSVLALMAGGCIGGRFATKGGPPVIDPNARLIVDRVETERTGAGLPPGTWVPELSPPAARAAATVARGDQSLRSAAYFAAQSGVTEVGRHVWSFAADCEDPRRFRPPPMVVQQRALLFATAAVPGPAGHTTVMLLIADPGMSALRADQMGGGRGGSNPTLETYIHPSVATGPCGESWPAVPRGSL
jgi:hypothetical protein